MDKPRRKWRISILAAFAFLLWLCAGLALLRTGMVAGGTALTLCSFYGGTAIAATLGGFVAMLCGRDPSVGIMWVLVISAVIGTYITLTLLPAS